ncbi:MAG TPA: STAS domain-containing protein [Anaerolineaceae bacterium]|nr:STAS domain-containing protein [Anaerolineaceae bacterium]
MDFKVTEYKRACVVKGLGRIDSAVAPDLERILTELLDKNKAIIIDMSEVDFVSSAGWWSIIRVQKELKKHGRSHLILVSLCQNVRESMDLIGILPYFSVYDELVDAIGSV